MILDTLFKQVHAINHMVGNPQNANRVALKRQATLLLHEVEELIKGIEEDNEFEIRDGVADVAFVLAGFEFMHRLIAPDLAAVVKSNMSKFDDNEEDAIATRKKYEAQGVKTRYALKEIVTKSDMGLFSHDKYYVTFADGEQEINGQLIPDGKWLKSHKYQEPRFD